MTWPHPAAESPGAADRTALAVLSAARDRAAALDVDVWQFAVEIADLLAAGPTRTDLRALVAAGLVAHAHERRRRGPKDREFRPAGLRLTDSSCFVVTEAGASAGDAAGQAYPTWDAQTRRLWWRGRVVKHFRQPADNQEGVLAAFQEEGWPARIDDPLRSARREGPVRLRETIRCLNRGRAGDGLRVEADGTGEGVLWVAEAPGLPRGSHSAPDKPR